MTIREAELAVVGGGAAALWVASLAAARGRSIALVTSGPVGSHASTRNQGWLHSGAFYSAYGAKALAEQCAEGSADVMALARRVPDVVDGAGKGVLLARTRSHREEIAERLSSNGIWWSTKPACAAAWSDVVGEDIAAHAITSNDRSMDSALLLRVLMEDALEAGATVFATQAPPRLEHSRDRWVLVTGTGTVRAEKVVLALGAHTGRYLADCGIRSELSYTHTRTRVAVFPRLGLEGPLIPLFDAGPTVIPVWHDGRRNGATICVPFDNVPASEATAPLTGADVKDVLLRSCRQFPGLASYLEARDAAEGRIYACEKLITTGQRDGTEESRSFRVDRVDQNLWTFYAGKFTTASVGARFCLAELGLSDADQATRYTGGRDVVGQLNFAKRAAAEPSTAFSADKVGDSGGYHMHSDSGSTPQGRYDEHCTFCIELHHGARHPGSAAAHILAPEVESRIIWQDDDLVVLPSIGPIATGHTMILTREHYLSFAHVPPALLAHAEKIAEDLCQRVVGIDTPILFEHGPMGESSTGGACTDHAHLHCLPMGEADIKPTIDKRLQGRRIDSLTELVDQYERDQAYIYYRSQAGESWVYDVTVDLPCQFLRRVCADALGIETEWDWLVCPRTDVLTDTLATVKWGSHAS